MSNGAGGADTCAEAVPVAPCCELSRVTPATAGTAAPVVVAVCPARGSRLDGREIVASQRCMATRMRGRSRRPSSSAASSRQSATTAGGGKDVGTSPLPISRHDAAESDETVCSGTNPIAIASFRSENASFRVAPRGDDAGTTPARKGAFGGGRFGGPGRELAPGAARPLEDDGAGSLGGGRGLLPLPAAGGGGGSRLGRTGAFTPGGDGAPVAFALPIISAGRSRAFLAGDHGSRSCE